MTTITYLPIAVFFFFILWKVLSLYLVSLSRPFPLFPWISALIIHRELEFLFGRRSEIQFLRCVRVSPSCSCLDLIPDIGKRYYVRSRLRRLSSLLLLVSQPSHASPLYLCRNADQSVDRPWNDDC